jgi:hypothetical protein
LIEYIGVIHIHTRYSDGTGSVEDIVKAASELNLDYVIISDHNTLMAKEEGYEGMHKNVMVIVGYELNDTEDLNHYLVFDLDKMPRKPYKAKNYVNFVRQNNGIGIIAHPHEKRNKLKMHPAYPWVEWDLDNFDGIEIWNHMSEWVEGLDENNKFNRFIHPLKSIKSPPQETLDLWDELNMTRSVIAIGSVDAHAFKQDVMGFINLEIFPYKVMFKSVHTHILIDESKDKEKKYNFQTKKKLLFNAIRHGHCFIANSYHGNAKGFRFSGTLGKKVFMMGDTIEKAPDETVLLEILCPLEADIYLLKDGKRISHTKGLEMHSDIKEPGAYRIEVYKKKKKAWIYSNHIRIIEKV